MTYKWILLNIKKIIKQINKIKLKCLILLNMWLFYSLYNIIEDNKFDNTYIFNIANKLNETINLDIRFIEILIVALFISIIAFILYKYIKILCIIYCTYLGKYMYFNIYQKEIEIETFECFAFANQNKVKNNVNVWSFLENVNLEFIITIGFFVATAIIAVFAISNFVNEWPNIKIHNTETVNLNLNNLQEHVNAKVDNADIKILNLENNLENRAIETIQKQELLDFKDFKTQQELSWSDDLIENLDKIHKHHKHNEELMANINMRLTNLENKMLGKASKFTQTDAYVQTATITETEYVIDNDLKQLEYKVEVEDID